MFSRLKNLFNKARSRTQRPPFSSEDTPAYSALIDAGTLVVLAVSDNPAVITFLNESMMDTYHQQNIAWPNYADGLPFQTTLPSYAHWSWNIGARRFDHTRPDVLTKELKESSILAVKKMRAVGFIMRRITTARSRLESGMLLQETVYLTKKAQALAFRDRGYKESDIFEFPYVLHHADFADLSYKEAADDIIFRAKLDDDMLAKTELLRMTYFARLKELTDASEIQPLLESFHREAFTNAYV